MVDGEPLRKSYFYNYFFPQFFTSFYFFLQLRSKESNIKIVKLFLNKKYEVIVI